MGYYIEYNTIGKSEKEKETIPTDVDFKKILYCIAIKYFTGIANVYTDKQELLYMITCQNGTPSGKFVKYCEFQPSSMSGYLSGVISRNWRQPEIEMSLRNGLVDGQIIIYNNNGTRHYLLNFTMGLLQGSQKHYTSSVTRIIHMYDRGVYIDTLKEYKNWLPRSVVELDEHESHKEVKMMSRYLDTMFKR